MNISPGTHISAAATALVAEANRIGKPATMTFNGIDLTALPGGDAASIVSDHDRLSAESAERWRASIAGQAAAAESVAQITRLQAVVDDLVARLPSLDFDSHGSVIDFLAELQPCTDRIGITVQSAAVVAAFADHGLTPNMCVGWNTSSPTEDVFYRWLVGQALDGLTKGPAIHGVFHKFANEWRAKWGELFG